jgi:hypothetical protein
MVSVHAEYHLVEAQCFDAITGGQHSLCQDNCSAVASYFKTSLAISSELANLIADTEIIDDGTRFHRSTEKLWKICEPL